ncbi:MAG: DMT family transporter [Gemmatimonadota bacterium]|nr:DMT family transporter [Gemmatimonadota bacterium]
MRNETKGTLAILGSSLGYGGLAVLGKIALLRGVEVIPLLAWRFIVAATLLSLLALVTRGGWPDRRAARHVGLLGVLYSGNSIAFMIGLDRIPAGLASLVFFTYPAVVVLLSRVFLGESLTGRRVVSLLVATAGCSLIVGQGIASVDAAGILWVLLAVALIAAFIMVSHDVMSAVPAIGGTALLLSTTAVIITVIGAVRGESGVPSDPVTVLVLLALGVTSTAIPVTLFLLGIRWIGPARASIFSTLEPLITVLLAAILLSERLLPLQLVGGALILGGVIWLRLEPSAVEEAPH